jgi:hypothetical protein
LKVAAVGSLALTAAFALPAFALEQGGDTEPVSATVSTDQAAARATTERYEAVAVAFEAERQRFATEAILAYIASLPPEEQFALQWAAMSDAERTSTIAYFEALEAQARAEAERAEAERAEAERVAAERAAARRSTVTTSSGNGVWDQLAQCESSGNWSMNSGNGFTGGLQFMTSTWLAQGGGKYAPAAYLATREQQIEIAERTLASGGWGQWPGCSRKLGLR